MFSRCLGWFWEWFLLGGARAILDKGFLRRRKSLLRRSGILGEFFRDVYDWYGDRWDEYRIGEMGIEGASTREGFRYRARYCILLVDNLYLSINLTVHR